MTDPLAGWNFDALSARRPAPIVPMPAAAHQAVRGKRVVIGLPGLGWRDDMRADSPVVQGSRTYVPVLPEQEWYRAEAEQIEAFAPLVPIERVWVETLAVSSTTEQRGGPDLVSRLVSLDAPPHRDPVPVRDAVRLTGRRVVRVAGDKTGRDQRDLRAVTEAYTSSDGDICVRVATELEWYRWAWSGTAPKTLEVPVHLLWLE
ncbi:hypothetical protein [Planosporangium mesophilum]|uniref:Uncharacterized protein n=1 Tax=Planosporangium mesophilum TaxID=689768 RepID=A0A8J3TG64_9ACTN|nr:hypothetical protein Pme01_47840 [Planosporangium mesophilum]